MTRAKRTLTVVVLVVALIASGAVSHFARGWRDRAIGGRVNETGTGSLSQMNSFALALLLGGLRGPLVMMLWMSSESQKSERRLEDFDTRVEWIRLLQPEFDTVHIFQIWNKAYNISVQMASLHNKYLTILDALEYARNVDRERPNNINILYSIGQIYFDKLGNSAEKAYYIERIREETMPHQARQQLQRSDPGWRPLEHETVLDAQGNIIPAYRERLHYLLPFEPFRYGLSPMALGYNYLAWARFLQVTQKQEHIQMSDAVVDSRPALALRFWAEEEIERARRLEIAAAGGKVPPERIAMESVTSRLALDGRQLVDPKPLDEAIFSLELASRVAAAAVPLYEQHIADYGDNRYTYLSHIQHVNGERYLSAGDAAYLRAIQERGNEARRTELLTQARDSYREARRIYQRMILQFYLPPQLVQPLLPPGLGDAGGADGAAINFDRIPPQLYGQIISLALQRLDPQDDAAEDDRNEYLAYIARADARLQLIDAALQQ